MTQKNKYIEPGEPLKGSIPYIFMDNARLACVHEFGGAMERRRVDYMPFVAWYEWLAAQPNCTATPMQLAARHVCAITFGMSFTSEDVGDSRFHVVPFTSTVDGDPALWLPMPFSSAYLVVVRMNHLTHEGTIDGFMPLVQVLAAPMHDVIPQRKIVLANLTRNVHDDICRFCGGRRDVGASGGQSLIGGGAIRQCRPAKKSKKENKGDQGKKRE